jgi:hypothetical protein
VAIELILEGQGEEVTSETRDAYLGNPWSARLARRSCGRSGGQGHRAMRRPSILHAATSWPYHTNGATRAVYHGHEPCAPA